MKITQKGQVTLPKRIRVKAGFQPGMEVEFVEKEGQVFLKKKGADAPFDRFLGLLRESGWKHTDELLSALRGRLP